MVTQQKTSGQSDIAWPIKTREIHDHHINSTAWERIKFRDDDIIIVTNGKSGTTWMQQIVAQLVFEGAEGIDVHALSPWIDLRILPPQAIDALEAQTHRRFFKTHLPVDALIFSPKAKYIFIGRDGRDATWSMFNHHINATDGYFEAFSNPVGLVGPGIERGTDDARQFYLDWFTRDGFPYWPMWSNIRSWWNIRKLPNVKFVHFNDMKKDLAGSIQEIARFLDIETNEATFNKIVEHCTFDYMKAHANQMAPRGGIMWNDGAQTFINKGTNGRWRDSLNAADIAAYEAKADAELGPECSHWLEHGGKI